MSQRLSSTGAVLSNSAYDAYGVESNVEGTPTDPFGYDAQSGYLLDRETGLYLCGHRYYDPGAGRWLTRDPIGAAGGINVYGYCAGGPVGSVDASGLAFTSLDSPSSAAALAGDDNAAAIAARQGSAARSLVSWLQAPIRWIKTLLGIGLAVETVDPELPEQTEEATCSLAQGIEERASSQPQPGWYLGQNSAGQPYVGSSMDVPGRIGIGHHQLAPGAPVDFFPAGQEMTRRELEIVEQRIINGLGGISKLGNVRNPVAPKYWPGYGIPPPEDVP